MNTKESLLHWKNVYEKDIAYFQRKILEVSKYRQ